MIVVGAHGGDGRQHVVVDRVDLGVGSTNTQDSLMIGGGAGSGSHLSIILGKGFLGCSRILSMMVCGSLTTLTLSIISPGGVLSLLMHLLTTGSGVGSLITSTLRFGGDTVQTFPEQDVVRRGSGGGGGGRGV